MPCNAHNAERALKRSKTYARGDASPLPTRPKRTAHGSLSSGFDREKRLPTHNPRRHPKFRKVSRLPVRGRPWPMQAQKAGCKQELASPPPQTHNDSADAGFRSTTQTQPTQASAGRLRHRIHTTTASPRYSSRHQLVAGTEPPPPLPRSGIVFPQPTLFHVSNCGGKLEEGKGRGGGERGWDGRTAKIGGEQAFAFPTAPGQLTAHKACSPASQSRQTNSL